MSLSKFLNPRNDVAFKRIFGSEKHKNILIHFINDILSLTGSAAVREIKFIPTVLDADIAYKKQSIVDVLCRDETGVQFIVEMQVAPSKGFEKRAQYYAAKVYGRQLEQGKEEKGRYSNLKKVIFIAIADCVLFPQKKAYKSEHRIQDIESLEHDLKDFSFTFIELPKFKKKRIEELETITEKWCYFFKYGEVTREEDLEQIVRQDLVIKEAYEALNQYNWSERELIAYEEEIKRQRDNEGALDYRLDEAEAIGKKTGLAEGKVRALEQNSFKNAKARF
jgi:predicted transposase/invertase (TIGR01784 family)